MAPFSSLDPSPVLGKVIRPTTGEVTVIKAGRPTASGQDWQMVSINESEQSSEALKDRIRLFLDENSSWTKLSRIRLWALKGSLSLEIVAVRLVEGHDPKTWNPFYDLHFMEPPTGPAYQRAMQNPKDVRAMVDYVVEQTTNNSRYGGSETTTPRLVLLASRRKGRRLHSLLGLHGLHKQESIPLAQGHAL